MNRFELEEQVARWEEAVRDLQARPSWVDDPKAYVGDGEQSPLRAELAEVDIHLPDQVDNVRNQGTLILGVGGTHQSMLLSIVAHRPARLILVVRRDGEAFLKRLRSGLAALPGDLHTWEEPTVVWHDASDPVRLFFALRRLVPGSPKPVSIDLTSGTKAMASIAFQLVLDAENRDIFSVYMQGDYLPVLGIPRPGTARIGLVPSASLALVLYEKRRLESLWNSAEFAEAARLLGDLVSSLEADAPNERAEVLAWRRLHTLAKGLCAWSEARYGEVEGHFAAAEEPLPAFVVPLCQAWNGLGGDLSAREEALKTHPALYFRQLVDAWCWLGRQSGRDPRLQLLRYFSLGESAMEGLVVALVAEGAHRFEVSQDGGPLEVAVDLPKEVRKASMKQAVLLLGDHDALEVRHKDSSSVVSVRKFHVRDIALVEASPWLETGEGSWRKVRNACAHAVGGVPDGRLLDEYRVQSLALILACVDHLPGSPVPRAELDAWATGRGWNPGTVEARLRMDPEGDERA